MNILGMNNLGGLGNGAEPDGSINADEFVHPSYSYIPPYTCRLYSHISLCASMSSLNHVNQQACIQHRHLIPFNLYVLFSFDILS